jgi:dephospho-CoA kinase
VVKVGLTGGIACGKSVVRRRIEARGIPTLDADAVVHRLLGAGTDVSREIERSFGDGVLAADGSIDRKALGAIVFADRGQREKLNAIVHPRVWSEIESFFQSSARTGAPIAVVDAALMVETGSYKTYDRVVVVHCRREQQVERLMARDGLTRLEAEKRIDAQMPIEEKRRYGDFLVDASGSLAETDARTDALVDELRGLG